MKTREKILTVAQTLFVAQGIHKTSTAQICREVGIASGSLFVHFKTKQDLVDAIYLERKLVFFSSVKDSVDEADSVEINIRRSSEAMVNYFLKNFSDFQYFQLLENGPTVSDKAREIYQQEAAESVELIKKWQASGALRQIDTTLLMDLWWGMLSAFIRRLHTQKKSLVDTKELCVIWEALGTA